jgi:hypothetical protein
MVEPVKKLLSLLLVFCILTAGITVVGCGPDKPPSAKDKDKDKDKDKAKDKDKDKA